MNVCVNLQCVLRSCYRRCIVLYRPIYHITDHNTDADKGTTRLRTSLRAFLDCAIADLQQLLLLYSSSCRLGPVVVVLLYFIVIRQANIRENIHAAGRRLDGELLSTLRQTGLDSTSLDSPERACSKSITTATLFERVDCVTCRWILTPSFSYACWLSGYWMIDLRTAAVGEAFAHSFQVLGYFAAARPTSDRVWTWRHELGACVDLIPRRTPVCLDHRTAFVTYTFTDKLIRRL